jgi:8-oxo-dGTP diphosphatase
MDGRRVTSDLPLHSVSVTGIVRREDGRILAIKRCDDGRWVPPGGVLELGETPQDGVVREVLEETGVKVEPGRLTGVYKNMKLGVVSLAILCRPIGGEPRPTDEASSVAWLLPSEAEEIMPEARAVRVTDALREDGPFIRVHDGSSIR